MTDNAVLTAPQFGAKDVPSALMRQTLLDRELVRPLDREGRRLLPWLSVVSLGGRSIIDRGGAALGPVVDELRHALDDHRLLILAGPGIRARHVIGVGLDLGLPTGVLAELAATEAEQNGQLVAALLAESGVSYLSHKVVGHQLAVHLSAARAVVSNGYPPYGLYEFPPQVGKLPRHRTDSGAVLLADAYGAARLVIVKDVDGVFARDPAEGADGLEPIRRVGARELLSMKLPSLPVDETVLPLLANSKHLKEIQIVNGLTAGALTRALQGQHVGTVIHA